MFTHHNKWRRSAGAARVPIQSLSAEAFRLHPAAAQIIHITNLTVQGTLWIALALFHRGTSITETSLDEFNSRLTEDYEANKYTVEQLRDIKVMVNLFASLDKKNVKLKYYRAVKVHLEKAERVRPIEEQFPFVRTDILHALYYIPYRSVFLNTGTVFVVTWLGIFKSTSLTIFLCVACFSLCS